jgi:hypothetical protein
MLLIIIIILWMRMRIYGVDVDARLESNRLGYGFGGPLSANSEKEGR